MKWSKMLTPFHIEGSHHIVVGKLRAPRMRHSVNIAFNLRFHSETFNFIICNLSRVVAFVSVFPTICTLPR